MNAIEAAYWAGARDAAAVIFSDLSNYPGVRSLAKNRARDLLDAMERLSGRQLGTLVHDELERQHRG
ncbi:MAG TPA: hypothetical protein VGV89_10470 [Thermoplasmata archaeon]|nr:hypothetical protein [Thermoplasmata archaeon]